MTKPPDLNPMERKALRSIRPVFNRSHASLRDDLIVALENRRPLAALESLSFRVGDHLRVRWTETARALGRQAVRSVRQVKDVDGDDVESLVDRWARENARLVGNRVEQTTRRGMQRIVEEGLRRGWSDDKTGEALVRWMGVTPTDASSLARQADSLEAEGVDPMTATSRRAGQMVRRRAEMIAATEANATRNAASNDLWQEMERQGQIAPGSTVSWELDANPCRVCVEIASAGEKPLGHTWSSTISGWSGKAPPAHPRCRCELRLIPKPFKE